MHYLGQTLFSAAVTYGTGKNVGREVELKISEEGETEDMWIEGNKIQLFSISTYSTVKLNTLTSNEKTSRI